MESLVDISLKICAKRKFVTVVFSAGEEFSICPLKVEVLVEFRMVKLDTNQGWPTLDHRVIV